MPHTKHLWGWGAILFLAVLTVLKGTEVWDLLPVAHAQGFEDLQKEVAGFMGEAIYYLNFLTWVFFVFLNFILDPRFIFDMDLAGNERAFMDALNTIWRLSRDLMNVLFAVVLIFAAVYTVITAKKDFISQYAPKFMLAVIAVNFSWFFPRVIIDVANVTAGTIYGIPSLIKTECKILQKKPPRFEQKCEAVPVAGNAEPQWKCDCIAVVNGEFLIKNDDRFQWLDGPLGKAAGWDCPLGKVMCIQKQVLDQNKVAGFSAILNGLVVNHARLGQLALVPQPIEGFKTEQLIVYLVREMFILLVHIALFFPLLAMTIAFFMRIPVLWITISFMPFIFLDMIGGREYSQGMTKKLWDTFLKAAFLPALVAIPFSVGFIMLNAMAKVQFQQLKNIPIHINDDLSDFWELLWLFICIGVIWVGVFMVLKGDDILSAGAMRIKDFGKSLGKVIMKAPLAVPLPFPGVPEGQRPTALGLMSALHPSNINNVMSGGGSLRQVLGNIKNGGKPEEKKKIENAAEKINNDDDMKQDIKRLLREAKQNGNLEKELLTKIVSKLGDPQKFNLTNTNKDNIGAVLQQLHDELQRKGKAGLNPDNVNFAAAKEALEKLIRNPNPVPPDAPPAPRP